jgi:hypothetical protein
LRFSRKACFNRTSLEALLESPLAGVPVGLSRLCLSSIIIDLLACAAAEAARPEASATVLAIRTYCVSLAARALAPVGALWQGSARLVGAFLADSRMRGMLP